VCWLLRVIVRNQSQHQTVELIHKGLGGCGRGGGAWVWTSVGLLDGLPPPVVSP
jgi:hypothetical protein